MAQADKNRRLSVEQENAIDLLVQGKNDRETAEVVGVARQTVTEWRNNNANFIAELNRRRQEVWGGQVDRLRQLVAKAVDVLADDIKGKDERLRQAAAVHILRAVGLYGENLKPTGPAEPEDVKIEWQNKEGDRNFRRMIAGI